MKKLALAFLTDWVYWFLTSLKSCISRRLFDANAERHRMFLFWSWAVKSGVNQELYLFLVLNFFNGASSTVGMRSISFQDTRPRTIRKACSLKCFRECLIVMRGGRLTADPVRTQVMRQWSLWSWLKTAKVYLEGRLVTMISMRVPVFTDLGFYLVGSMIICVRLGASILDCRMAGVLNISQFRLPNSTLKINGGQLVHIWCPGRSWGLREVYSKQHQWDLFLERWIFKSRSSNCLGTELDSMTKLCRLSLQ